MRAALPAMLAAVAIDGCTVGPNYIRHQAALAPANHADVPSNTSNRSRDQTPEGYGGGVLALVDMLDADRALLDASERLSTGRETAGASVAANGALSGGWEVRS